MACSWPEQGDGEFNQYHSDPYGDVVATAPRQHQPAQWHKNHCIGDEMAKARVAEGCAQHPPQRQAGPHRQIPLATKEQLIDEFLTPGQAQQQQRNQPAADHLQQAGITMMAPMGWVG